MSKLLLATEEGLVLCERNGDHWRETARGLSDHQVTSVTARAGVILAGTTRGVYRSDNLGKTWTATNRGLMVRHVRWLAYHPEVPDLWFAGVEPAGIFISRNGGELWQACPEVAQLRDKHGWSLPYSPEAGCVRGFAIHGSRVYAAAEVGGALRSDDHGETWRLTEGSDGNPHLENPPEPFIYPGIHSIEGHPSSPDLVYAPTGKGFYRSHDGGKTWKLLYECYCRAVWVDPLDADHLILGPADGVDRNGRIETSHDGGQSWSLASNGLQSPWQSGMVERFAQAEESLFAVLSYGELLAAPLSTLEWRPILSEIASVNSIAIMQD